MKVLTRISTLETGKVKGSLAVDNTFWYEFLMCILQYIFIFSHNSTRNSMQSCGRMRVSDKAVLERLCSGSSGDIRSAVNSLQFFSLPGQE